ncbi:MAG: FAD-dependent oxidoreductase [Rhodospirillales bacterium]|nr:FAD-dependent oxidoreductase [Rhodospirillales bacterium]
MHDPASISGKTLTPEEQTALLVVGAGPAGLAAALEAARRGQQVVLVDENPVPAEVMGGDIPLLFGNRMSGAARNRGAMLEAFIASDPAIAEAFDAGVDVRLGTTAWGIYVNGPSVGWLPGPVAGLSDGTKSWMIGCGRIVVATGRRDMGLAFPGWDLPGVLGMTAALRLAARYGALAARRAVVLGSTAEALDGARQLQALGVEIAAVIETAAAPLDDPGALPLRTGCIVRRADGDAGGVSALVIARRGEDGLAMHGTDARIDCDAIILGIGAVPMIDLLDAAGCHIAFSAALGGHVPVLDGARRSSIPAIAAAGDCAGIWPAKSCDAAIAQAEGRRAASGEIAAPAATVPPTHDMAAYRLDWVRATVLAADAEDTHVCRCEEVTAREILEVRPPRYLGWPDDRRNRRDLRSLLGEGPPNPDQVKRLTRAGMGVCQGRRCREQVACLLALSAGCALGDVPAATHRAPVRPLPLAIAAGAEDAAMAAHWDTWFGMNAQYQPYWEVPPHYTAAGRDAGGEAGGE